jgi:hypothetical protein
MSLASAAVLAGLRRRAPAPLATRHAPQRERVRVIFAMLVFRFERSASDPLRRMADEPCGPTPFFT